MSWVNCYIDERNKKNHKPKKINEYYLQDKRQYVGNDLLFWAKNCNGYTTDVSKAHVFTEKEAFSRNRNRETDVPWPKEYIDSKVRPAVDHQYVNIKEALKGTGLKLTKPPKQKREVYNCVECGRFLSGYYSTCRSCGADNLP